MRNRPEITAFAALVPRALALGGDAKSKNPSSVTPGARRRWTDEERRNGIFEGHGFLAQAMVRNPPDAGGSGQLQALYHAGT
jgi:hypothetical protein